MEVVLSSETQRRLERIASERGTDCTSLIAEALERWLDYEESFLKFVEEGEAAADRGELISHEEVGENDPTLGTEGSSKAYPLAGVIPLVFVYV